MKRKTRRVHALLLAAVFLLTACGQSASASVMQLVRTEGTVGVQDDGGKDLSLMEKMNLYSGYQIGTGSRSYAWIDLDKVKLVKMDEDSDVELQKDGKALEILVNSGSLFFHVTEPLEEDETMNIRTSTMAVGIRGTCGWVRVLDECHMQVYILEGTVQCEVADPDTGQKAVESVSGGEMADLFFYPDAPEGERCAIFKKEFSRSEIPAFVLEETDLDALGIELAEENTAEKEPLEPVLTLSGYEGFGMAKNGVMPAKKDGLWGAVDYQGEVIVPFEYTGFQAPNEQGYFVLINTTTEEKTEDFLGEPQSYEVSHSSYTLYDPQGTVLYTGDDPVRASGDMYILHKSDGDLYETQYYKYDGTLVQSIPESFLYTTFNGFHDGISTVYRASFENSSVTGADDHVGHTYSTGTYQFGELDQNGDITWYDDPRYDEYLAENEKAHQEAIEWERAHGDSDFANGAGHSSYWPRIPLNTANHGYCLTGSREDSIGFIYICDDHYKVIANCDIEELKPDAEQGFTLEEGFYDETNSYRGFYHDGAYFYNYGPNMVLTLGDLDVLVDFTRYPGMTYETTDNRIVKAVYDRIYMDEEAYWLIQKGSLYGYIDHDGNEAALFEDATSFCHQHALVIENGIVYLIDESFEKIQELGEADSVTAYGDLFAVTRGDTRYFYQINP